MIRRIAVLSNLRLSRLLYPAFLFLLAGCVMHDAPTPLPPPRHAALGRVVPPDRVMDVPGTGRVPLRVWRAHGMPRAVILALHGFNDSRDAWERPGPVLAAHGITVYAPDQPGFGAMPDRGGWAGTDAMVAAASAEAAAIHHENPDIPLYVAGESMGGAVAVCMSAREAAHTRMSGQASDVAGYILLAPAVWDLGVGTDATLGAMAMLAPRWRLTGRELPVHVTASDDMLALARLYYDPLTLRTTRTTALAGLALLMHRAAQDVGHMQGPVLAIYGGRDQLVPASAMNRAWAHLPPDARRDFIPAGYHLLLRGREGDKVTRDIISWIGRPDDFLPSGGDIAASTWNDARAGDAQVPFFLPARMDGLVRK
ncbi:alpha/beta hydrolase [Novacetimonas hansenii]|uniref:Alpha/beta hydrolase n=1 Tax=Novacetimonas hansenii TaxID=436 RepID=A0AAW5EQE8_NOVHA|nr:alpha/beta fold hydrolase [Novacetimonas hansenii]MCJ8353033.1 alpha/beta hydrolase [Novacetimonas hansenii]